MSGEMRWRRPYKGLYETVGATGRRYQIKAYGGQFWELFIDSSPAPGYNQFSMLRNAKARAERIEKGRD